MQRTLRAVVVSLALCACDGGSDGNPSDDAGNGPDAGQPDGAASDATLASDANSQLDGSELVDGQIADATGDAAGSDAGGPAHCSPGTTLTSEQFFDAPGPDTAFDCFDADYTAAGAAGVFASAPAVTARIWSVELANKMKANQPYAASLRVVYSGPAVGGLRLEI
jgi:hypothetical protein